MYLVKCGSIRKFAKFFLAKVLHCLCMKPPRFVEEPLEHVLLGARSILKNADKDMMFQVSVYFLAWSCNMKEEPLL